MKQITKLDKDFKATGINMLTELQKNTLDLREDFNKKKS